MNEQKTDSFKFFPGEYLRDTQNLSEAQQVAYDRIMCEHIRNICVSHGQFDFFTKRLKPEEKAELKIVLTEIPAGYQISWVAREVVKSLSYKASRGSNGSGKDEKSYAPHIGYGNGKGNGVKEKGGTGEKEKKEAPEFSDARLVLQVLNESADRRYGVDSPVYHKFIYARLREDFTVQDLLDIVAYKVQEWKGKDMERYLHPETLFNRTKCTKYRDEVRRAIDKGLTAEEIRGKEKGGPKGMSAADLAKEAINLSKSMPK